MRARRAHPDDGTVGGAGITMLVRHNLGLPAWNPGPAITVGIFAGILVYLIVLGVFNMVPIPPLDGSHVVASLLPDELSVRYRSVGFFGIFLILILMRWHPFAVLFGQIIGALAYPLYLMIAFFQ